ncbi:MAG: hypothetical protein M3Z26_00515 [Bacteroidota bacterium]|nr:hypothetical protein [Bacteroidota bacterium]
MARPILQIQQQILDSITSDPTLGTALTSTSKRAIYRLFAYIIASAINILEQLIDVFTTNVETVAATASPATPSWLQAQVFKFQYSATVPQTIQLINFAPSYPVVDPSLQIITRCSVTTSVAGQVQVKVAKGTIPTALASGELTALQSYIQPPYGIGIAGITYNITSGNSDKLFVKANIYYSGQFSSVISANVITAINTYLSTLPFNGKVKLSDLELAIREVTGVNDVLLTNVSVRPDAIAFGSGTSLIQSQTIISRIWNTVSGYIVPETTTGQDLASSLTFIAE